MNGNWTYTYDDFNHLKTAANANYGITFDYDRYGNRWHEDISGANQIDFAFNSNNRTQADCYDAAGNLIKFNTCAGNSTFVYDAENRMYAGNGWTFAYYFDALGRRTRRISPSGTSDYFYDLGGRFGLEVNGSTGTANRMEVYALGRHLATYSNGTTYLSHSDLLGTERVRSNASGGTAESYANLPFGDFMQPSGNGVSPMHFTGQERDPETGLDHFLFRYYNSTQGRWMSPDPAGLAAVDLSNPQSLNRYAYVMNRPTVLVDPLGKNATNPGYCDAWNESCGGGTTWDGDLVHSGGGFSSGFNDTIYGNWLTPGALDQYLAMVAQAIAEARKNASDAANNGPCLKNVGNLVNAHLPDAQTLANSLGNGVTPAEVLAVAGNETHYGDTQTFARFGNFFGLHGSGPAGTYYTTDNHTPIQKFPVQNGFLLSGQQFVNNVGPYMQPGMGTNPLQFFTILNQHGYATGNSGYPAFMVNTSPKNRGPYTLVSACMGG